MQFLKDCSFYRSMDTYYLLEVALEIIASHVKHWYEIISQQRKLH